MAPRRAQIVFQKVYKLMMPAEDYDEEEAKSAVHEDWATDSRGKGYLTRDMFIDAVFELADVWTVTTEAVEYASFLADLHEKIAADGDFRPDDQIQAGSGKPDGFDEAIEESIIPEEEAPPPPPPSSSSSSTSEPSTKRSRTPRS